MNGHSGLDKCDVGGFAMVPHWVLDAVVNPVTLRVWCVLARHANTEGAAYPSVERVATMAGVSASTLRRSLNELQVIGALEIRARHDAETGRQQSNMFYLRMAHPSSRQDVLGVADMTAGRVSPMTPSQASTHDGGEGVTHDTQNNNQEEQETTTSARDVENSPQDAATAHLLQTAALGQLLTTDDDPNAWWRYHDDPLVRAFVDAQQQVPKFASHGLPDQDDVERMVANLRAMAPDDDSVVYELGTWVVYNKAQPKKGGQKNAVMAFRNWCGKRAGSWALERERRKTRNNQVRGRGKRPSLDPLGDHERLMDHGVEEPFQ